MVADRALTPATRLSLGGPLPHQQADRTRAPLKAPELYRISLYEKLGPSNITPPFGELFPTLRQITHALLTRLPLSKKDSSTEVSESKGPFDLHTLGTQPTLILSYDQTLIEKQLTYKSSVKTENITNHCYVGFT